MEKSSQSRIDVILKSLFDRLKERFGQEKLEDVQELIKKALRENALDKFSAARHFTNLLEKIEGPFEVFLEPENLATTCKIFGFAEFLARFFSTRPELLEKILTSRNFNKIKKKDELTKECQSRLDKISDFNELVKELRLYKYQEFFRLCLLELEGKKELPLIMNQLSLLAEVLVSCSLNSIKRILSFDYGKPNEKQAFCVIALGKLGSYELNFSSDLDLIYLCSSFEGETSGGKKGKLILRDYFTRLAELLTRSLSQITENGFVFRIDLRLRPGGSKAPLVLSFDSALEYYLNFGSGWERAAFLRARPIAGDISKGEEFLKALSPFIFRRHYDFTALEELKEMKQKIKKEASVQKTSGGSFSGYNIKLAEGGIRELEFIVQALQLAYGGKMKELQVYGILNALDALGSSRLLGEEEAEKLKFAYVFLRRVEHHLQLREEQQEYCIPQSDSELLVLANSLGFKGKRAVDEFSEELRRYLNIVSNSFQKLFGTEGTVEETRFEPLLKEDTDLAIIVEEFRKLGFEDPKISAGTWQRILKTPPRSGSLGAKVYRELLGLLLEDIIQSPEPDLAVAQLDKFLAKWKEVIGFLSLLKEHMPVRKFLFKIFGSSEFLGNIIINSPELLDELVTSSAECYRTEKELKDQLDELLFKVESYEEKLDVLRRFQRAQLLQIGSRDLAGELSVEQLEKMLSSLATVILEQAYKIGWDEVVKVYGKPKGAQSQRDAGILILGMGKFGSEEMSYGSDLDLVFIYEGKGETDGERSISAHEFFVKLAQKIITTIITPTREGVLYRIDTRLRPGGAQGALVVSRASFESYHQTESQTFEKQSLLKARIVVDGAGIGENLKNLIEHIVFSKEPSGNLATEMLSLKRKVELELAKEDQNQYDIKFGRGGEMEVEYIIEYLQLKYGPRYPELRVSNSWKALERLRDVEVIGDREFNILMGSLKFFRHLQSRLRIYQDLPEHHLFRKGRAIERIAKLLGYSGKNPSRNLLSDYQEHRDEVNRLFRRYFNVS